MATMNGAVTPPVQAAQRTPPPSVLSNSAVDKRKREEDDGSHDQASSQNARAQRDILGVLRQYETNPSFLDYAFEPESRGQSSPKKAKISSTAGQTTSISAKLADGAYAALEALSKDAERVNYQMVASIRDKARDSEGASVGRHSVDDLKQIQKIQAFAQAVKDVVDQEGKYAAAHGKATLDLKTESASGYTGDAKPGGLGSAGIVLTLFGNAPTPRQLFSSRQILGAANANSVVTSELPVEEMSLPMGMTATKVMPGQVDQSAQGPTFEEAFAPPHSLQLLHPPKSHRRSTTRDDSIPWKFKDPSGQRNRKGGYTVQSLTVGDWLGYGGVDGREDPISPREKRKQRDRALSSGESTQPPPSQNSAEETLAKEEDALFRRAYSSFAPSCDNSKSVVPEQIKNMMWWHRVGTKRYSQTFAIDPALMDDSSETVADGLDVVDDWTPDEDFEEVIKSLKDLEDGPASVEPARNKTDVDNVLGEISSLLETLASHQRIRNACLPQSTSASRTPISPAPFLASRKGKPDAPAEDEVATYNALRREIAYLILRLPPYAVAKLDGEQLSELGVRKLIPFETKDVKGIMEEDHVARLAKHNALATAGSIASLIRPGSTGSQHYSSINQRAPAIGQAANTRYGQAQYSVGRPSAQQQPQRPTSNQSSYGTPSNTAPRTGGYNQYSRPGAPQTNGQHYYQRSTQPSSSYGNYSQQYGQGTPQTQQRPGYSQPLAQYTQSHNAARNAVAYQSNQGQQQQQQQGQSPFNRTASPVKPAGSYNQPMQPRTTQYQTPQQYSQTLQQQLPGSGRTTPANHPSQPHTPVNGYQRPTPQTIAQAPLRAASGTPQPIAQAPPRAASGTPQPPPSQAPPPPQQVQANGA